MELFRGRYLCFISFLFLAASFAAFQLPFLPKLLSLIFFCIATAVAIILTFVLKKRRFASLVALLSLAAVLLAFFSSFLFISIPQKRASELEEHFYAEIRIISREYHNGRVSEYIARLEKVNGASENLKCYVSCPFDSDFSIGDRIIADVSVERVWSGGNAYDDGVVLYLEISEGQKLLYSKADSANFLSPDGFRVFTRSLRDGLSSYIDGIFNEDGALVKGMLINDRSDISEYTRSRFNRAGASHLLAVSGLHVSLLLGALELLLRKLYAPKKLRISLIAICGLLLLALTDFSASAVRSVLMLFFVYLYFALSEENDSPTALFVSISIIVLLSPYSVVDIGMWLSFCATLGLVVVYPVFERKIPRPKKSRGVLRFFLSLCRNSLSAILITTVATFFTLPIMCIVFGTFSIAAIPTNLILSPLSALFLPLCVIALVFGKIAYVGEAIVLCASGVGRAILAVVRFFADMRGALVSLRYPFAFILVLIFSVTTALLLVIKLRRKMLVALPALCFALCFAVCLGVFSLTDRTELSYVGRRKNEFVTVERAGVVSVIDVSTGADGAYSLLRANLCEYSTEIENYLITHMHSAHASMIERLCASTLIRKIYLPLENKSESLGYAAEIRDIAERYGSEVIFFDSGEEIQLRGDLFVRSSFDTGIEEHTDVFFSIYGSKGELTYSNRSVGARAVESGAISRYFIVGAHGEKRAVSGADINALDPAACTVIYAEEDCVPTSIAPHGYIMKPEGSLRKFSFLLE